jgi:UDP-N-acetylmuramate--alanine ligase
MGIKAAHRLQVVESTGDLLTLQGKRFHLVGIGGVGMSALAQVLLRHGARVTGSDARSGTAVNRLQELGAEIGLGHAADHMGQDTQIVVMSAAIREDNPEFRTARARGLRIFKYAEMLGQVMSRYRGIAVAGTHGKSTTTAWLSYVLRRAGVDVSFVVGAGSPQLGGPSGVGTSPYFVAEACEYDRSFLNLRPAIACLLNVEADHLDYYRDEADIVDAFTEFALGTEHGGAVVVNGEDANLAGICTQLRPDLRCVCYGFSSDCDVRASDLELVDGLYRFHVDLRGQRLGTARIALAGRHNVLNALAVIAIADELGLDGEAVLSGVADFTGIDRRLMHKGCERGVTVLDDYAHHPTEIRCTLAAIRERYPARRLWCVFQPHQYSRTCFLLDEFSESFKLADVTLIPEIYAVRDSEEARRSVNAERLTERLGAAGCEAVFMSRFETICDHLCTETQPGDVVVTMGAGDVWKVADEFIRRLRGNR